MQYMITDIFNQEIIKKQKYMPNLKNIYNLSINKISTKSGWFIKFLFLILQDDDSFRLPKIIKFFKEKQDKLKNNELLIILNLLYNI